MFIYFTDIKIYLSCEGNYHASIVKTKGHSDSKREKERAHRQFSGISPSAGGSGATRR
jgi:hypothetical protein